MKTWPMARWLAVALAVPCAAGAEPQPAPTAASSPVSPAASSPTTPGPVAQPTPSFGGPAVALTPVEGVTVTVPKGWIACDDANNAKLGPAKDPMLLAPKLCVAPKAGGTITFGAFDPVPMRTAAIYAGREPDNPITEGLIARMSQANLDAMTPAACPVLEKPLIDAGATIDSCILARETLGGHAALVFKVVFTPSIGAIGQAEMDACVVPMQHGVLDFNVTWAKLVAAKVVPTLDAIRASLQVQ